ncbi:MAG: hypothetical protein HUU35_19625, partial [Armatimonadetes bacterium]|nr:hypothetical protein [Armatimonadota bacterium]
YASATRDVERLLREFRGEKVDGVVMDLRNNGGGSLDEAVAITGLFIDKGPVVQAKASGGDVRVDGDTTSGVVWDGPLAVQQQAQDGQHRQGGQQPAEAPGHAQR